MKKTNTFKSLFIISLGFLIPITFHLHGLIKSNDSIINERCKAELMQHEPIEYISAYQTFDTKIELANAYTEYYMQEKERELFQSDTAKELLSNEILGKHKVAFHYLEDSKSKFVLIIKSQFKIGW